MLSEASIIKFFKNEFPDYIGDDAAVIQFSENESYVITKDLFIEDVHFRIRYHDAANVGHKALHVNLSDIAAMGASPMYAMLGIALPVHYALYADTFIIGFAKACKASNVILIGGDTTRSAERMSISVTLIGKVPESNIKLRSTAKIGDVICIVGNLGYAHIGLHSLEKHEPGFDNFKEAFLRPIARVAEGKFLGQMQHITSMMDISDGLYLDLNKLCKSSGVGAQIDLDKLHYEKEFKAACKSLGMECTKTQLIGGEDYGLLFTVPASEYKEMAQQFCLNFGYTPIIIGEIIKDNCVKFIHKNVSRSLQLQPFYHFGEIA